MEREILILWRVTGDADGLGERDVGGAACRVLWLEPYRAGSDGARCCLSLPELWPSSCFFFVGVSPEGDWDVDIYEARNYLVNTCLSGALEI